MNSVIKCLFPKDSDPLDIPSPTKSTFDQGYKKIKSNPSPSKEISIYKNEGSTKEGSSPMQLEGNRDSGSLVEKSFKLFHFQEKDIEDIKNKAAEYGLYYEIITDEIQVVGDQLVVFEFLTWLYDFLNMALKVQKEDFGQEEISISTFHRLSKEDILDKAEELNVICEFKYHTVVIAGLYKNLTMFKSYLAQVEMSTKNPLYPKYWDFEDTEMYSEIIVRPGSEEFKEVLAQMRGSLFDAEILSLTRIQNNYLIAHYLTNLSMRQEVNREAMNRKLLFHGTRDCDPSKVYGNFDTGFDLQYAKESGTYGKGLYFSESAGYSHGFSYRVDAGQKKYKMILADVFLGKVYDCSTSRKFVKAPDGFDSLCADEIHVIYNNFHSYPLYLIEYKTNNRSKHQPAAPLLSGLTMTSFVSGLTGSQAYTQPKPMPKPNLIPILQPAGLSVIASKRVQKELTEIHRDFNLQNFLVESAENNLSKVNVTYLGAENTPYEAGIFRIEIIFPHNYPISPPTVIFKTPIYHPCIDKAGYVCLGLLTHWNPSVALEHLLLALSALLYDPNLEEPLETEIANQYRVDRQGFVAQARSWTRKHAY